MSFKQSKKSMVKRITVKLGEANEELISILDKITFDLVNINLNIKKSYVGLNGTGYTSIGFVNGFDKETNTFDVVVFENRLNDIAKLGETVIVARVFNNKDGKITKVTGLDIVPVEK